MMDESHSAHYAQHLELEKSENRCLCRCFVLVREVTSFCAKSGITSKT